MRVIKYENQLNRKYSVLILSFNFCNFHSTISIISIHLASNTATVLMLRIYFFLKGGPYYEMFCF